MEEMASYWTYQEVGNFFFDFSSFDVSINFCMLTSPLITLDYKSTICFTSIIYFSQSNLSNYRILCAFLKMLIGPNPNNHDYILVNGRNFMMNNEIVGRCPSHLHSHKCFKFIVLL